MRGDRDLLSPKDVRVVLGISRSGVYRLLDSNEIANFRIGRRRVIKPDALQEYLDQRQLDRSKTEAQPVEIDPDELLRQVEAGQ